MFDGILIFLMQCFLLLFLLINCFLFFLSVFLKFFDLSFLWIIIHLFVLMICFGFSSLWRRLLKCLGIWGALSWFSFKCETVKSCLEALSMRVKLSTRENLNAKRWNGKLSFLPALTNFEVLEVFSLGVTSLLL